MKTDSEKQKEKEHRIKRAKAWGKRAIWVGIGIAIGLLAMPAKDFSALHANLRPWLELFSFAVGPVAAYLAYRALRQVRVASRHLEVVRQNNVDAAKRDSFKLAAEQARRFADVVIPLMEEFDEAKKVGEYPAFSRAEVKGTWPNLQISSDFAALRAEAMTRNRLVYRLANEIEGVAIFFSCGIAAERVVFSSLAVGFCHTVNGLMPFLAPLHVQQQLYSNTLHLYATWHVRAAKIQAEQQLEQARQKAGTFQDTRIDLVGVDSAICADLD